MKFWVMIFSAALFAGGTCLGVALQPKLAPPAPAVKPPEPSFQRHGQFSVSRFVTELGLSEEQDHQLDTILDETHRDEEAFQRALRAAQDRSRDRIREILTDEQRKKLDELTERERRKRNDEEIGRSVGRYSKILALNPEQTGLFRACVSEAREKRSRIFKDRSIDHAARGTHLRAVREQQNEAVRKFVSTEQYARYVEIQEFERNER